MKLTCELLVEALQEYFKVEAYAIQQSSTLLSRPLMYVEGQPVETGNLYLTCVAANALCRNDICTIYAQGVRPTRRGGSFICINGSMEMIANTVQRVFNQCEEWENRLEHVLLHQGEIRELFQVARTLLDNPILLTSVDFAPVAQLGEEELPQDQRLSVSQTESLGLVNSLKRDMFLKNMMEERKPFRYPAHILGWNSWIVNIFRDGYVSHRLILVEHKRELTAGDGYLLSRLAEFVDFHLKQKHPDLQSDNRLRAVLLRMLSDRTADYLDVSRQLSLLNWKPEDEYFCLVLKTTQVNGKGTSIEQIHDYLKKQYPSSCSCLYNDQVVTYFNVTRLSKDIIDIGSEMKYFVREALLKAGYSRVMRGHDNLRRQYIQAHAALETGGRIHPYMWIHHFDNVSMRFLLEEATHRLPAYMLCNEKLLLLQQIDEEQGTEYMKTLRVYLDLNLNAMASARELYIHRSTLLYRLSKIKEVLDSALDDPEEILYLSISFRLLETMVQ